MRSLSDNDQNTLSNGNIGPSQQQEVKLKGRSMEKKLLKMPAEIKLIPQTGQNPFMWKGPKFDTSMRRSMISDDMESSLGMMEVITPIGVEIAGRPATITAWVTQALGREVNITSDT